QFVRADRVSPPPPCQVLFVGSSSIVKWKETLASDMAPMPVIDRGFGGSHIEYVNRWFDEIVAPHRPRAIVFYAGENDIDAGTPMLENGRPKDIFVADGLHMSAAGYAIWTREVRAALLPDTESEARRCARAGAR